MKLDQPATTSETLTTLLAGELPVGWPPFCQYNFVAYRIHEGQVATAPLGHDSQFIANRQRSLAQNYLEDSKCMLGLSVKLFEAFVRPDAAGDNSPMRNLLVRLQSMEKEFSRLAILDSPLIETVPVSNPSIPPTLHVGYQLNKGEEQYDTAVYAAICDFFSMIEETFEVYDPTSPIGEEQPQGETKLKKANKLFANANEIDLSSQFGMPKFIGDTLNQLIKSVFRPKAIAQYKDNGRQPRFVTTDKNDKSTYLDLDPVELSIKAAEGFADQLMKIKDAKILQTFCAIWKYANTQDSCVFWHVPISEVMKIVLKEGGKTNYSVDDRRQFTQALAYLSALSITVQVQAERTTRQGKKKAVLIEEKGVRLLRIQAEYALKKAYQHLAKDELMEEHFDRTVITQFSGELLPGYNHLFRGRANIYSDKLLQLNANKDRQAIVLGFILQTRFNQFKDKEKPVSMQRGYLIEQCDYQKSDKTKPAVATKQLRNVLEKLRLSGIISRYENLTNNSTDEVRMYPPV